MVDTLSRKLIAGKNDGIIPSIKSTSGVEYINHALFADDTLLFGGGFAEVGKNIQRNYATLLYHFRGSHQQLEEHYVWMERRSLINGKYFSNFRL